MTRPSAIFNAALVLGDWWVVMSASVEVSGCEIGRNRRRQRANNNIGIGIQVR